MNTCLKMIFLLTLVFGTFVSEKANAEFKGCNDFCGRRANNLWANEVKNNRASGNASAAWLREKFDACMQQTLDEGKTSVEQCNGDPSVANVPVPSANPNRCEQDYSDKVAACDAQLNSAKNSCDSNKSSAFASSGTSTGSSEGIADACKKSASLSGSAKDAWTSFGSTCSTAMNGCMDACAEISTWAQNNPTCFPLPSSGLTAAQINQNIYSPKISQCMDLQSTVDTANKNASTYSDSAATSAECEKSTTGGKSNDWGSLAQSALGMASGLLAGSSKTEAAAAVQSFCTTNPAYPGCSSSASLNCSDPTQAASNKVCICAASPRDAQCMTAQTESSFSNSAMIDSSSRLPSTSTDNLSGGDIPNTNVNPLASKLGGSGSADGIDGRQGGAPVGNSTVGSGSGPNRGAASAGSSADPGAGSGFMGGSGGGGRGFGSSGSAAAGSAGYRAQNTGAGNSGRPGGPDLRQFLPGGMQDPRARGMIGGVGTDGITGPHTNIWNKVQNRYQILKDTLYP